MADNTKIEWTEATWNPVTGCSLVSEGCRNCYAAELAATRLKNHPSREGLAKKNAAGVAQFNGKVRFNADWLDQPLKWKRPRKIFVCAHADLFHENVPDEWIDNVFAVMALCPQHVFQVLTKRPERMQRFMCRRNPNGHHPAMDLAAVTAAIGRWNTPALDLRVWPLPNVWLGVSIEDQPTADERIPYLLKTPAAVRFISAEPLLGAVDLTAIDTDGGWSDMNALSPDRWEDEVARWDEADIPGWLEYYGLSALPDPGPMHPGIDWVICGGESGWNARPMHPDWARALRDQCAAAGVAFLFKQWGVWAPQVGAVDGWSIDDDPEISRFDHLEWNPERGAWGEPFRPMWCDWDGLDETQVVSRIGKARAGRLLDGVTHDEFPERGRGL
jgi:protein gp37